MTFMRNMNREYISVMGNMFFTPFFYNFEILFRMKQKKLPQEVEAEKKKRKKKATTTTKLQQTNNIK